MGVKWAEIQAPRLGPTTVFPLVVQRWLREDETAAEPAVVVLGTEKTAMERG
jgi:hypothetical protein